MEKLYTTKDYAEKAIEANKKGEKLYIHTFEIEYDTEVLDFENVEVEKQIPILDENGIEQTDDEGNIITETIIEIIQKPVMIDKIEVDEEGNEYIVKAQLSHKETKIKEVAELIVAPANYYICYKDNYTDGTINENLEAEKTAERQKQFEKDFFEISEVGYYRKFPKGYSSAIESINTAFNAASLIGKLPSGYLTFYKKPNFKKENQCSEEWMIEHSFKNEEMTVEEFGQLYSKFVQAWNIQEHL